MPFSSVLGASSVIRPGVCTSTTRPTVPFTGQLIFETDTSRLAVWTGSAWQYETAAAGPPGLVYITGASFTTATSVSLPNNTFNSTYRNYRMIFQITAAASDATISMRVRASGSDISTSSYDNTFVGITNQNATSNVSNLNQTSWNLGEIDTTAPWCYMALDIIAPQVTTNTFITGQYGYVDQPGNNYITRNGSGVFRLTTQIDSLSVISSAASSMTGIYRVYGYTDS